MSILLSRRHLLFLLSLVVLEVGGGVMVVVVILQVAVVVVVNFWPELVNNKLDANASKYKFGPRAAKHKLVARAGKHIFGTRAVKYKLGTGPVNTYWGAAGPVKINWRPEPGSGVGKYKYPERQFAAPQKKSFI